MNKLTHLKETKSFLRKVISCRRNLLRNNYGKKPSDALVISMFEIDYKLGSINNFDNMMKFIENHQVQHKIKNIIPSNKDSWREMLDVLIHRGLVLQGKITSDKQLKINL